MRGAFGAAAPRQGGGRLLPVGPAGRRDRQEEEWGEDEAPAGDSEPLLGDGSPPRAAAAASATGLWTAAFGGAWQRPAYSSLVGAAGARRSAAHKPAAMEPWDDKENMPPGGQGWAPRAWPSPRGEGGDSGGAGAALSQSVTPGPSPAALPPGGDEATPVVEGRYLLAGAAGGAAAAAAAVSPPAAAAPSPAPGPSPGLLVAIATGASRTALSDITHFMVPQEARARHSRASFVLPRRAHDREGPCPFFSLLRKTGGGAAATAAAVRRRASAAAGVRARAGPVRTPGQAGRRRQRRASAVRRCGGGGGGGGKGAAPEQLHFQLDVPHGDAIHALSMTN